MNIISLIEFSNSLCLETNGLILKNTAVKPCYFVAQRTRFFNTYDLNHRDL